MVTDLCEGAFQPNFAKKRLKITKVLTPVKVSELMLKLCTTLSKKVEIFEFHECP